MSFEEVGPAAAQNVVPHGPDRARSIDEVGGIGLAEDPAPGPS
jgi:hypothetical protein